MPPSQIRAVTVATGGGAEITSVAPPELREGYVLVRTTAVGLNPTDWKSAENLFGRPADGCRLGCDYAGVVEAVGPGVARSDLQPGVRVAGFVHGGNQVQPQDGAFADYIVAKADIQIVIPDNVPDEAAATLGVGITTVGQGLYQSLGLPLPNAAAAAPDTTPDSPWVLIYGGSTATGLLGIQYARLSGYRVVTACSPRQFSYVKALGVDAAFDYADPTACTNQIRAHTGGRLTLAWDCVSTPDTARVCASALSSDDDGVRYWSLLFVPPDVLAAVNPKITSGLTFAYTAIGEDFDKFQPIPANPVDHKFAATFWALTRELLAADKVKPVRQEINRGGVGLEGVPVGLKELQENKASGVKLVYTL